MNDWEIIPFQQRKKEAQNLGALLSVFTETSSGQSPVEKKNIKKHKGFTSEILNGKRNFHIGSQFGQENFSTLLNNFNCSVKDKITEAINQKDTDNLEERVQKILTFGDDSPNFQVGYQTPMKIRSKKKPLLIFQDSLEEKEGAFKQRRRVRHPTSDHVLLSDLLSIQKKLSNKHLKKTPEKKKKQDISQTQIETKFDPEELSTLNRFLSTHSNTDVFHNKNINKKLCSIKLVRDREKTIQQVKMMLFKEKYFRKLNKDSYHVYDSMSDEEIEENEHSLLLDVFHPQSYFMSMWISLLMISQIYLTIFIPLEVNFLSPLSPFLKAVEVIIDIIFLIHIVINFFTPYPHHQLGESDYEFSVSKISKKYLTTWFIIDLVLAIPASSIINLSDGPKDSINLLKFNKLLFLIDCIFNEKVLATFEVVFTLSFSERQKIVNRFLLFFLIIFAMNNIFSSIWILLGLKNNPSWIVKLGYGDSNNEDLYLAAMYYNFMTIFSVGYGDIFSTNKSERIYTIFVQSIGIFFYSYIVSYMTYILKKDESETEFDSRCFILDNIKMDYDISELMYNKLKKFLFYDYQSKQTDRIKFLKDLPNSLKNSMITAMYKDEMKFSIFKNTNIAFKTKMFLNFRQMRVYLGEEVLKFGSSVENLTIVKRGVISVDRPYKNKLLKISKFRRGDHFGGICMLLHKKSTILCTVKSKFAELYQIEKDTLLEIFSEFPNIFEKVKKKMLINHVRFNKKIRKEMKNFKRKQSEIKASKKNTLEENSKSKSSNTNLNTVLSKKNDLVSLSNDKDDSESLSLSIQKSNISSNIPQIVINNYDTELSNQLGVTDVIKEESESSKGSSGNHLKLSRNIYDSSCVGSSNGTINNCIKDSNMLFKKTTFSTKVLPNPNMLHANFSGTNMRKLSLHSGSMNTSLKLGEELSQSLHSEKKAGLSSKCLLPNIKLVEEKNGTTNDHKDSTFCNRRKTSKMISPKPSRVEKSSKRIKENLTMIRMSINQPTLFFGNEFEKWRMDEQIKRIVELRRKVIKNVMRSNG